MSARPGATAPTRLHRLALLVGLCSTLALAWGLLARGSAGGGHRLWHPGPHATDAGTWIAAVLMWQVMMTAMMLPVVWPWLRMVAVTHARQGRGPVPPVVAFAAGYFASWLLYAVAAATAQVWFQGRGWLAGESLALGPTLGGVVLVAAGAFQFSAIKHACLEHCRSPFGYLLARWKDGPPHAFRLGLDHGLYCVACCWALMAVCFAVGVMSLSWMAVITLAAVLEQIAPGGQRMARLTGAGLIAWGLWVMAGVNS